MKKTIVFLWSLTLAATLGFAGNIPSPALTNPEFERLKTLVGHWQGFGAKDQKPVTAEYQLTSGGAALLEVLFPGTPHEMVSIYYPEKGSVGMTHYCMIGNRPNMQLANSTDKEMEFKLAKKSGLASNKETHMHALKIVFSGKDKMTQTWTLFENGKEHEQSVFEFTRVS